MGEIPVFYVPQHLRESFFSQNPCQFLEKNTEWPTLCDQKVEVLLLTRLGTPQMPTPGARMRGSREPAGARQTENEETVTSQIGDRQMKIREELFTSSLRSS